MRFVFQSAVCNAVAVAAFQELPLISSVSSLTSVKKLALPRVRARFSIFFLERHCNYVSITRGTRREYKAIYDDNILLKYIQSDATFAKVF